MKKVKPENRFADETYSMVKSFVIRGNILTYQTLEGLAESKNLDEMLVKLKGTEYAEVVSNLQSPYTAHNVERAFRRRLANIHQAVLKVTPKTSLLASYYLKFMAGNLKVLLKGRAQSKSDEEIGRHLDMYAEELVGRRDLIVRALSAETLDQTVEALKGSEFAREAESALEIFKDSGKFQIFDIYIDKTFYGKVLNAFTSEHKDDARVRDIVAVDVDSYNTLAVLRGRLWNLDPSEIRGLLVEPFFDVTERCLKDMIDAESVAEAVKILSRTSYRKVISQADLPESVISGLEDAFRVLGYQRAMNPFLWDIHKISIALGAVKLSELEVKNLSAIAFGVEQHIDFKDIMARIVLLK
ncbi:MAG: V-type ATPase subunit [Nitrososphaerales archaeon]